MHTPAPELAPRASDSTGSPTSSAPSSTSDSPFFPSPTPSDCASCTAEDSKSLQFTKNAVEGALIVVAVALILAITIGRLLRLRRHNRPFRHFFRVHSHPPYPSSALPTGRPSSVPRTTGLPPAPAPPVSVIVDSLASPLPSPAGHRPSRARGRRTHAADVDARGRRGPVRHPEDPVEELPEYDDKDVLPRYQDVAAGCVPGSARAASAPVGLPPARQSPAATSGRAGDEGQMVGIGTVLMGRSPNGDGGTSDTDPLVNRTSVAMSEDHGHGHGPGHGEHAYPPPTSSAGSHEGWHDDPRRHD